MHIVLLGGAGYLGTAATRHLTALGHHVTAVDGLIYQRDDDPHRLLPTVTNFVHADLRDPAALRRAMTGADAVVHLGGLVGEPACAVDERLAVELNYASPVIAAEAVATAGIAHYVLFSSCSVYGSRDGTVDEDTAPNPLGIYARTKILAEQRLGTLLEGRADLTVLRLATVHGRSPRQRLDSVVNRMTAQAVATAGSRSTADRSGARWCMSPTSPRSSPPFSTLPRGNGPSTWAPTGRTSPSRRSPKPSNGWCPGRGSTAALSGTRRTRVTTGRPSPGSQLLSPAHARPGCVTVCVRSPKR